MNNTTNNTLEEVSILSANLVNLSNIDLSTKQKVVEKDFIYRIITCYEEKDKYNNYEIVDSIQTKINEITSKAIEEERATTEEEQQAINKLNEELKKAKKQLVIKEEYTLIMKIEKAISRLNFNYAIKQNKYTFFLHRNDFVNNIQAFKALQKLDDNGHLKNTINLKNIKSVYNFFSNILLEKLVKANKATEEEKKQYNLLVEKAKKQLEEKKKKEEEEEKKKEQQTNK